MGLCLLVGAAYFLAARLSLDLLTKPDGVAAFWPAAGVASGTLIALGSRARLPIAVGVMLATVGANVLGDRNIPGALVFALCNAGEAILIAHLINRQFGACFSLDSVHRVLVFFAAVAIAAAASGVGGSAGFALFHGSTAPVLTIWANWFASDALGSILVAPVLIGLGGLRREVPARWELAKGALTLAALVLVVATPFGAAPHNWYAILPLGLLLPVLVAAHCRPLFAATAVLILGLAVISAATFGIGDLDGRLSLHEQVYAARATLLALSIGTLMLAALFAEREQKEAALKDSNERLQLALDAAELGVWSIDAKSGRFESDTRDKRIHGHPLADPPTTLAQARPSSIPKICRSWTLLLPPPGGRAAAARSNTVWLPAANSAASVGWRSRVPSSATRPVNPCAGWASRATSRKASGRNRLWPSATRSSRWPARWLWLEASPSTSPRGSCKSPKVMRPSTVCLREALRPAAVIGARAFMPTTWRGSIFTSSKPCRSGGAITIANTVSSLRVERPAGSSPAA